MRQFIAKGFKLISRLDRDTGVLIDNCLGFLYSIDLGPGMRKEIGQIESALYDMVYLGRTPAGHEFKENLFRTRILPLMKRVAPAGAARLLAAGRYRLRVSRPPGCGQSASGTIDRFPHHWLKPSSSCGKFLDTPFCPIVLFYRLTAAGCFFPI